MSVETDIKLIDNASKILANVNDKVDKLHDKVDLINNTSIKPKDMIETESAFNKLVGSGKGLLGTFSQLSMSLYGVKEVFNVISSVVGTITSYSDSLMLADARLNLINNNLENTNQLWQAIYNSSRETRGNMLDTADVVAKLGLTAKGVFKNNKELVQFSENLTKSFKIAGTSTQGISASMLQLSQAMASGVLRGEELNSVFENAPLLIQNIADYMEVPIGKIRELASEGKITADIVKNAILDATDEINNEFEKLPMTFEELSVQYKNIWDKNMLAVKEDMQSLPQIIADSTLDIWDGIAYGLSSTLSTMDKQQSILIQAITKSNNTMYENLAKSLSSYTGLVFTELDAMKISFSVFFEFIESVIQKAINGIAYFVKATVLEFVLILEIGVGVIMFVIDKIAGAIDKITGGLTNLSDYTEKGVDGIANAISKTGKWMFTFDNISGDDYFDSKNLVKDIWDDKIKEYQGSSAYSNIYDPIVAYEYFKKNDTSNLENKGIGPEKPYWLNTNITFPDSSSISSNVSSIAKDISDISKSINNLNDLNKAIMEINEATYHNNVANQFNGSISITNYGVDEEGQKAIGKATEEAIRKVFLNDYQNTQAMGVYA